MRLMQVVYASYLPTPFVYYTKQYTVDTKYNNNIISNLKKKENEKKSTNRYIQTVQKNEGSWQI